MVVSVTFRLIVLAVASVVISSWLDQKGLHAIVRRFRGDQRCIVLPLGGGMDDTRNIEEAVDSCNPGSVITLPSPYVYSIQRVLTTRLERKKLEVSRLTSVLTKDLWHPSIQ